jgi:hypothetical protein
VRRAGRHEREVVGAQPVTAIVELELELALEHVGGLLERVQVARHARAGRELAHRPCHVHRAGVLAEELDLRRAGAGREAPHGGAPAG